mgnify:FL=1
MKARVEIAFEAGVSAWAAGEPAIPSVDQLTDVSGPVGTMDRRPVKAWLAGWHAANLSGAFVCANCGTPAFMDSTPAEFGGVPIPQHRDARGSKTVECPTGTTWVSAPGAS